MQSKLGHMKIQWSHGRSFTNENPFKNIKHHICIGYVQNHTDGNSYFPILISCESQVKVELSVTAPTKVN